MPVKNFDVPFKNVKGETVTEPRGKDNAIYDATLADLAMVALQANLPDDQSLPPRERNNLISLAIRIGEGGEREYTTTELALILKRAEKTSGNLGLYRLTELIDAPPVSTDPPKE
mgnify:CR=1 FL=1